MINQFNNAVQKINNKYNQILLNKGFNLIITINNANINNSYIIDLICKIILLNGTVIEFKISERNLNGNIEYSFYFTNIMYNLNEPDFDLVLDILESHIELIVLI